MPVSSSELYSKHLKPCSEISMAFCFRVCCSRERDHVHCSKLLLGTSIRLNDRVEVEIERLKTHTRQFVAKEDLPVPDH